MKTEIERTLWIVAANSDEFGRVYLADYAGRDRAAVVAKIMEGARRELFRGTLAERLAQLGWGIVCIRFEEVAPTGTAAEMKDTQAEGEQMMNPAALEAALRGDLDNALVASTPGGIERQEAAGQRTLVASTMLPKEIEGATREQLTALGFKFGADVDELFVTCDLPPGWTKRGTDHSMHSDLLDEQGRLRAGIFYKAAFYDRRADMTMKRRFNVEADRDGSRPDYMRCVVTDGNEVVFDAGEWKYRNWECRNALEAICKRWLNDTHPEWQNPLAYW